MSTLQIKTCPVCGSPRIRRVKRDLPSTHGGVAYTACGIELEECPDCGERLFSPESLHQIAAQRTDRNRRSRSA